jgi:hypothetical protein
VGPSSLRGTVELHDRKRHGRAGNTLVLIARLEQHGLSCSEFEDLTVVPRDLQGPADHHQQLGPRRGMPPDRSAWLQQCGDYLGGPSASQNRRRPPIAGRVDWMIDGDTVRAERFERDGLDLNHLHPTMLGSRLIGVRGRRRRQAIDYRTAWDAILLA